MVALGPIGIEEEEEEEGKEKEKKEGGRQENFNVQKQQSIKYRMRIVENFRRKNFRRLLTCDTKGTTPPNLVKKTFMNSQKTTVFVKVFSLERFPLYGSVLLQLEINGWVRQLVEIELRAGGSSCQH